MIYVNAILIFIAYHAINIPLAFWNVQIVISRIGKGDKRQINHFLWAAGYLLICVPQYFLFNIWFAVAVVIPHLSIFAPAYNHYRGFAPFNLSRTSNSMTDRILVKMGFKDIEGICILAEILAIALFTISLYHL